MIRKDVIYGEIPGIEEGSIFKDRMELMKANVHTPWVNGIAKGGASIVLNEGYKDDKDFGDEILYTGEGGRGGNSKKHVKDQTLTKGNLALANNQVEGIPVRVSRGPKLRSPYAPDHVYRYDGLYRIDQYWSQSGDDGCLIYRYKLIKCSPSKNLHKKSRRTPVSYFGSNEAPKREVTQVVRVIRDSKVANEVKNIYEYKCQICCTKLVTPVSKYAEGCHIKPLGIPHNGKDNLGNILCLCANCHVLFDYHALTILDDFTILETGKKLNLDPSHKINIENIKYKRNISK